MFKKKKGKGFSTLIGTLFAFLFLMIFFYLSYYTKALETIKLNIQDDADAATMAAAIINEDMYDDNRSDFYCIGGAKTRAKNNISSSTLSVAERAEVEEHLLEYASSLTKTAGMTADGFKGGNIGWAASALGAKDFNLDELIFYDFVDVSTGNGIRRTDVIMYRIENLSMQTLVNASNGSGLSGINIYASIAGDNLSDAALYTFLAQHELSAPNPTVQAVFSFDLDLPYITKIMAGITKSSRLTIKSVTQVEPD